MASFVGADAAVVPALAVDVEVEAALAFFSSPPIFFGGFVRLSLTPPSTSKCNVSMTSLFLLTLNAKLFSPPPAPPSPLPPLAPEPAPVPIPRSTEERILGLVSVPTLGVLRTLKAPV